MQASQTMDETALVRTAQTDIQAFGSLYDRYVQRVYRYCRGRTQNSADAEDLTAGVFMAALEALPRYRGEGGFGAWLFAIARRKVTDHYRRASHLPLDEDFLPPIPSDIETGLESSQSRERLLGAIATLAEQERELIHLRYAADLSFAEIAAVLQRNEEAVKKQLYRLIARLKSQMEADHE